METKYYVSKIGDEVSKQIEQHCKIKFPDSDEVHIKIREVRNTGGIIIQGMNKSESAQYVGMYFNEKPKNMMPGIEQVTEARYKEIFGKEQTS